MKDLSKYNYSDFSNVVTIYDNKKRAIINALCITITLKHASLELGISERCLRDFMSECNITTEDVHVMRKRFVLSKIKIKLQYKLILNGKKTNYCKSSKIKN
tara:strand:+ start:571 stop:876 length:306 start_codon:yes stop_codon:yes gene_type:complete